MRKILPSLAIALVLSLAACNGSSGKSASPLSAAAASALPASAAEPVASALPAATDKPTATAEPVVVAKPAVAAEPVLKAMAGDATGIFLHHSTGGPSYVWGGGVPAALATRNAKLGTAYAISEIDYPNTHYDRGWANYPSDYYRLWVGTAGSAKYPDSYDLDTLCSKYDLIIWKHCYPVMEIEADGAAADPASDVKTLANYKAAYKALKAAMRAHPANRFIVWTGAVEQFNGGNAAQAQRLKDFRDWVINAWDEKGDNIFVFDFWLLETEGGLYNKHAVGPGDDHPNPAICASAAPRFAERIVDVLQGRGDIDPLTGN